MTFLDSKCHVFNYFLSDNGMFSINRKIVLKMLAKTGLLIVSNPTKIGNLLNSVKEHVKNTLYIQFLSNINDPLGSFYTKSFNSWPKFSPLISGIYSQAAHHCNDLDVRILLSSIKYKIPKIETQKPIDLIIFDKTYTKNEIDCFIESKLGNLSENFNVLTLNSDIYKDDQTEEIFDNRKYNHVVLGGTFDRLHLAHKLILSEAVLRSQSKVTIGVTEENMLTNKILWEFIEDIDKRMKNVEKFLLDICPELEYKIVGISDPFGPAIIDPTMELIVVSRETIKGADKINSIRKENNLSILDVFLVELIDEPNRNPIEEEKISSSTTRIRLLGTVLREIENKNLPNSPYIIGLTGGIASGKSGVKMHLENLGAYTINADLIGHEIYKPGKDCYKKILNTFGNGILKNDGEIDRKLLGGIVFQNKDEMDKLNKLVWPSMEEEIKIIIKNSKEKIIVIEAAVLLTAGWDQMCHEIWTTVIPREEAINRLINRNKLTSEEASNRINSQPSNKFYVQSSNVVFCTLWPENYTKQQVVKAWNLLMKRINQ